MLLRDQWVVWSESEGYRLQVSKNGVTKEVPISDDDVIEFAHDCQIGDDYHCYHALIRS